MTDQPGLPILDTYLGYEARDWVAEALARERDGVAAQQAAAREADAMRSSAPPPHRLADYATSLGSLPR